MPRVLVIYDISDNVRRLDLADALTRYGLSRIQRSAFAGEIDSQRFKDLIRVLREYVKDEGDVIHVISLGIREWENRIVFGREWGAHAVSTIIV